MKIVNVLAPLAALFALGACTAPTEATPTKDVYYATPAGAAAMSIERITTHEGEGAGAGVMTDDHRPFFLGESGLVPASSEEIQSLRPEVVPPHQCYLCEPAFGCLPICCPGTPHCLPVKV
jgi:hypothetical protein